MSILDQIEDFKISSKSHLLILLKLFLPELLKDACSGSDKLTPNIKLSDEVYILACVHLSKHMAFHTLLYELSEVPLALFHV